MDFQTILIYLTLSTVMWLICREIARTKLSPYWVLIPVSLYALIFGMRYGVGMDFHGYWDTYCATKYGIITANLNRWEEGFAWLCKFCAHNGFHPSVFLTICAFVPLACVFLSVRKYKWIFPFLSFTFMIGGIWLSYANGLRQIFAFGIFALAIPYLYERKWMKYGILICIATLFHTSSFILLILPILYLRNKTYFNNIRVQYILLTTALICSNVDFIQTFFMKFESVISTLNYSHYIEDEAENASKISVSFGIGYYVYLISNILIIKYSNKAKILFRGTTYALLYDLAFIGILIRYVFTGVQLMGRINYYFDGFNYIVGAFTLYYLSKQENRKPYYIMLGLYVLRFFAVMYRMHENTAFFRFFWQV